MFTISFVTWIFLMLCKAGKSSDTPLGGACVWNNTNGTCVLVSACEQAKIFLHGDDRKTVQSMNCGFEGVYEKVCCLQTTPADRITFNTEEPTASEVPLQKTTTARSLPPPPSTVPSNSTTTTRPFTTTSIPSFITSTTRPAKKKIETANELTQVTENVNEFNYTNEIPSLLPSPDPLHFLPNRNICGLPTTTDRIFGGDIAALDEFPWIVRIKYKLKSHEGYACAGVLITDRYVLTAAHCIFNQNVIELRLGEWDTLTNQDCYDGICSEPPVDMKIDKIILHPRYSTTTFNHDIAILRMEQPVQFTDFVRPICLPTSDYVAKQDYIADDHYTVAGWGVTEFGTGSTIKRKINVNAVSMDICQVAIPFIAEELKPYIICAGGKRGKDSCRGDSGGGLMKITRENYSHNWYLYGIVSFGVRPCGAEGKPGIYTRITAHMDWILENISA